MASFTSVGDTVSLTLPRKGETAAIALSGTYNMTIALQREVGSPSSGMWETLKTWTTADATVAYSHVAANDNERLRLIVLVDTSGTCTATLTDASNAILSRIESGGKVVAEVRQDGVYYYDGNGDPLFSIGGPINVGDVTAYTVLEKYSGRVHLIPDLTADCTFTLPTPRAGLRFRFQYSGVAADTADWIFDAKSDTNFFYGGLIHIDTDANSAGDEAVPIAGDGDSNSKMTILVPNPGTWVELIADGTNWHVVGAAVAATVPSFADQ